MPGSDHTRSTSAIVGLLGLLCLNAFAEPDGLRPLPADLPHQFGLIGLRLEIEQEGIKVTRLRYGSPADSAGVQVGDRLLGADGYRFETVQDVTDYVQSLPPDSTVTLHIDRDGRDVDVISRITDRRRLYGLMIEGPQTAPPLSARHRVWLDAPDATQQALLQLIEDTDSPDHRVALERALADERAAYGYDGRLPDVEFALTFPLAAARPVDALAADLSSGTTGERITRLSARLFWDDWPETDLLAPTRADLEAVLLRPLRLATETARSAAPSPPASLSDDVRALLERFDRSFYIDEDDAQITERHVATLRWAKSVDGRAMTRAAILVAQFAEPDALKRLERAIRQLPEARPERPPGVTGRLRYTAQTDLGWLVIGDTGPNTYGDAAIIIDLGGDDLYTGGGRATPGQPVGLIIDLAGNDRYIDRRFIGIGGALGGVTAVIDVEGDDLYEGGMLTQAAAFAGVALLVDRRGHDTYLADGVAQSAALFGAALLVDGRGNDLYSAAQIGQAFGGAHGVAALVDEKGDDRYLIGGSRPSSYGTEGVYRGWGQGAGCGLRGYTAGGIGVLVDRAGDDRYHAGNFSQGVGYFFGLGGLVDENGNDQYAGTRYTQGSAAHQAAGVLIDRRGNDVYSGRVAANQGAAWDAAVALLLDGDGDDRYEGGSLAQGAAAMNGFGALVDGGGNDRYSTPAGQAYGGSTSYWGGRNAANLGLLIDRAGRDDYDVPERADGLTDQWPLYGLFRDMD